MSIKYRVPTEIKVIVHKWGDLGFDLTYQALQAILTHDDWATRWDLSDATLDDLAAVNKWRNETINGRNWVVYNEHTNAQEFEGTPDECQSFIGNYGGGWSALRMCSKASFDNDLFKKLDNALKPN